MPIKVVLMVDRDYLEVPVEVDLKLPEEVAVQALLIKDMLAVMVQENLARRRFLVVEVEVLQVLEQQETPLLVEMVVMDLLLLLQELL